MSRLILDSLVGTDLYKSNKPLAYF